MANRGGGAAGTSKRGVGKQVHDAFERTLTYLTGNGMGQAPLWKKQTMLRQLQQNIIPSLIDQVEKGQESVKHPRQSRDEIKAQIAEKRDKISMQQQMLNAATEARKDFIKKKEDEMAKKLAVKQQEENEKREDELLRAEADKLNRELEKQGAEMAEQGLFREIHEE